MCLIMFFFNENHFPFSTSSTGSQPPTSSSNSYSWLSSLLFFHLCQNSSVFGPLPIPTPPIPPTTNTTPPIHQPPNPVHLPSILGPHPFTNTPLASLPNPTPQAHLLEPIVLTNSPSSQMTTNVVHVISPIPNPNITIPNPSPSTLPLSSHPMTTRSKSGISKKKVFSTTTLDYLQTEPPNYIIASKILEWHTTMVSEFNAL
jgi:hypothetical protein